MWHDGLLCNLLRYKIEGKFYDLIKILYSKTKSSNKHGPKRRKFFDYDTIFYVPFEKMMAFVFLVLMLISVRGGGGELGGLQPPLSEKQEQYSGKTDVPFGQRHSKNILLFNILIYLFLSRNSPSLLTDVCTTSRDGCYYLELEH